MPKELTEERVAEIVADVLAKSAANSASGRKAVADEIRAAVKAGVVEGMREFEAKVEADGAEKNKRNREGEKGLFERVKGFLATCSGEEFEMWLEGVDVEDPKAVLAYLKEHCPDKYKEVATEKQATS